MSAEDILKEYILSRCGSVYSFSKKSGISNSTVDTILKRGILNSRVENMIKVCRYLGISLDALLDNRIVPYSPSCSLGDQNILTSYRLLPDSDRETVDFLLDRALKKSSKGKEEAI